MEKRRLLWASYPYKAFVTPSGGEELHSVMESTNLMYKY